ncbi:hypothetical protein Goshw_004461, partial [Gossypium schwendimanii]|nr:hypothetical protein [Gossypium schwendimanii]
MVQVGNVPFSKAEKHGNEMVAYALAIARIKRP